MRLAFGKGLHLRFGFVPTDFRDSEDRLILVRHLPDAGEESGNVGVRHVVLLQLEIERSGALLVARRRRRIVTQFGIEHQEIERIDAPEIVGV